MGSNSSSGHSYETTTPLHFKSLSTKTGRSLYADNEKQLGSLPTIHHQGRGGRRKFTDVHVRLFVLAFFFFLDPFLFPIQHIFLRVCEGLVVIRGLSLYVLGAVNPC